MPVTKMVNAASNKSPKPQRIVIPASAENSILDSIGANSEFTSQQLPTTFKPNFPTNMKTTYTAPVTTFHPKGTVVPIGSTFNPKTTAQTMPQLYPKSTVQTVSTFHPKNTQIHPKTTLQTAPIVQQKTTFPIPSTFHPKATLQNDIPIDFVSTYHPKAVNVKVTQILTVPTSQEPITTNQKFSSRYNAQTTYFTPTVTPTIRPSVKNMLASIGLEPDDTPTISIESQKLATFPGPITTTTTTAAAATTTTTTTTTTTPKPELTNELKELLASFGLLTNEEAPAHVTAHVTAGPYQDEFHPIFPNSLKDETLSVSEFKPLPKSVTASDIEDKASGIESSFEIKGDDFSSFKPLPVTEEKSASDEELEKILKSYGLLEEDERGSKAVDAEIERLNDDDSEESGSETFEVTEKPYKKMSNVPEVDVGFLSPDLAKVLGSIGVKNVNKAVTTTSRPFISRRVDSAAPTEYTTGPAMSSTMKDDYQKLHLLLDTIKQLDNLNANLTEEELEKLNLKNFNLSRDTLLESVGPDPKYDDTQSPLKNEVKRQTSSSEPTRIQLDVTGTTPASSSSSSSSTASDDDIKATDDDSTKSTDSTIADDVTKSDDDIGSTPKREGKNEDLEKETESESETEASPSSSTSTTEESRNGSISDLAGSFGGNDGLDPVSEEPLPPPRKNGFYFFSDWNSFLEVGEDPDKVVVRFDPKIGDPTQFVPIKIP